MASRSSNAPTTMEPIVTGCADEPSDDEPVEPDDPSSAGESAAAVWVVSPLERAGSVESEPPPEVLESLPEPLSEPPLEPELEPEPVSGGLVSAVGADDPADVAPESSSGVAGSGALEQPATRSAIVAIATCHPLEREATADLIG